MASTYHVSGGVHLDTRFESVLRDPGDDNRQMVRLRPRVDFPAVVLGSAVPTHVDRHVAVLARFGKYRRGIVGEPIQEGPIGDHIPTVSALRQNISKNCSRRLIFSFTWSLQMIRPFRLMAIVEQRYRDDNYEPISTRPDGIDVRVASSLELSGCIETVRSKLIER